MCVRERDRQRDRETETDRKYDRQTENMTDDVFMILTTLRVSFTCEDIVKFHIVKCTHTDFTAAPHSIERSE